MRQPFFTLGAAAFLVGILGCGGDPDPAPPSPVYSIDLQPGDAAIPPSGVAIVYVATLRQNGQPLAYPAVPQWTFLEAPAYSVGTLTPMPDAVPPDPSRKSCYYQPPGTLPQGITRVTFKVRVQVQAGGQNVEASRTLTMDTMVVLPPIAPPAEKEPKAAD